MKTVREQLERAERQLRLALDNWSVIDPSACGRSCECLEQAIVNLETAREMLGHLPERDLAAHLEAWQRLNSVAWRMTRLVDAAAVFWRGMSLQIGPLPMPGAGISGADEPLRQTELA